MEHHTESLTLYNDGQVPCQFEFIKKLDEPTYSKPWLTANPHKGFLAQGGYHYTDPELNLCCSLFVHEVIEQTAKSNIK